MECWWPWPQPEPSEDEIQAFIDAIRAAGVQLIGLNFFAGDMPAGERGVVSQPDRIDEFRANVPVALRIGAELGCKGFNALYGNREEGVDPAAQDDLATENLAFAARAAAEIGGTVFVEPLAGAQAYPLLTSADALGVIRRVRAASGLENIGFLLDVFHVAANGDDVPAICRDHAAEVAHCQIADFPGRGEPGTGSLDIEGLLATLRANGYDGWVSLEYNPTVPTPQSFGNLPSLG